MDALERLEERINKAVALIDKLKEENQILKSEKDRLGKELAEAKARLTELERKESERADAIKTKLGNILDKLGMLEQA
ncbi:MAG: cell division protein ZapB [Candidatus Zixiibacteriota bacterium]|jgi:FtsZ-binding cell division protein ZapB